MSDVLPPATTTASTPSVTSPHRTLRVLWVVAGVLALLLGLAGVVLPLLPTTPFVLLAAFCFSRGSQRWEHWLLHHRRLGPMVRDWRASRAIPLRAKQLATLMMTLSSIWAFFTIPSLWRWAPGISCACVALWMWSLPTRRPEPDTSAD